MNAKRVIVNADDLGLGQAELIPCAAKVEVEEAKVRVSCTFNHIPDAFVRAANKAN